VIHRTRAVAVITAAAVGVVGVLSAISIQRSYDSGLASEGAKLAATAQVTAALISQQMAAVEDIERATLQRSGFITAVGSGAAANINTPALQLILNEVQSLRPEFQFAAFADAQGTTRATAPLNPAVIGKNFSFRDWYRGIVRTESPYVSSAYIAATTGAPLVIAVASPVRVRLSPSQVGLPTGPVIGVLFIGYKIGSLQAFATQLAAAQQINLLVTDQAGIVLTREGGISGHLTSASGVPGVAAARAGQSTTSTSGSEITGGVPIGGLGWTVIARTPVSGTTAAAQRGTAALIASGLLLLLTAAGAALVLTTRSRERAYSLRAASEAELRTVQQALTEAIQVFGPDGTLLSRNPAADRLYDLAEHERTTAAMTPEWDLLREDGSILPMEEGPLAIAMRTGETSEGVEVGIRRRADDTVKWLSISTVPIRGRGSAVTGYVSCARDVTERVQTIRDLNVLSRASQRLGSSLVPDEVVRALTSAAGVLCSVPGEPQRRAQLFRINGPRMTLTGEHDPGGPTNSEGTDLPISEHPYIQRVIATHETIVAAFGHEEFGPAVAEVIKQQGVKNCAWVPLLEDHRVFAVLAVAGRQHGLITTSQLEGLKTLASIGGLALSNAEAHEIVAGLARTDPLTGVGNRRALDDRIAHLPRTRFALVAVDVDDLKKVNDGHGHEAGDDLLVKLSRVLSAELRPSDMLARTGGDEFVALLVDCDANGAVELGKRLEAATSRLRFTWGAPSISVGSAAGAAGDAPEQIAKTADVALYAAKRASKERARAPAPVTSGRP
jgi:diguanylate cyclase (GGDEF)-like protein/PAS domain S-box-containing protein